MLGVIWRRRNAQLCNVPADLYIGKQLIEHDVVTVLRAKPGIISPAVFVCRARAEMISCHGSGTIEKWYGTQSSSVCVCATCVCVPLTYSLV